MFENLKAFIRHGKNAEKLTLSDYNQINNSSGYKPTSNELPELIQNQPNIDNSYHQSQPVQSQPQHQSPQQYHQQQPQQQPQDREFNIIHDEEVGANEDNNMTFATQIVQQENIIKKQKVKYPKLENYKVMEQLGEGAFSIVYKAENLKTGELVAIKILRKFQMDNVQKQSVLKEVTIMRQLDHPNIVKFIEFIDSDPYYYIVQELVTGGEIFSAIVEFTYLSEDLSRHIIIQVAQSIRYLHEEVGIVHRDIKPENLLYYPIEFKPSANPKSKLRKSDDPSKLDEGDFIQGVGGGTIGKVKLADFGLSKQIWEHNTKTPCGTVGYTAPEIVRDEKYSKEVDMWAIGCVLYTLLCGFPPFYDERIDILTEKVAKGEYTFLSPWWDEISSDAKYCVSRLLTVDPSKRYSIDDFLNDPWITKTSMAPPKIKSSTINQNITTKNTNHPIQSNNNNQKNKYKKYGNELYSPAAVALRDAFDISTAVHRTAEESKLSNVPFDELIEEDEEETDQVGHVLDTPSQSHRKHNNHAARDTKPKDLNTGLELNLNGASILERRKNKAILIGS